jgi:hypothetical protein
MHPIAFPIYRIPYRACNAGGVKPRAERNGKDLSLTQLVTPPKIVAQPLGAKHCS